MIRAIVSESTRTELIELATHGSPDEAASRLASGTGRGIFAQGVVGSVSPTRVRLKYRGRMANSFAPILAARFESEGGTTYLRGRFSVPLFTRVFMTVWFGGIGLWCLGVVGSTVQAAVDPEVGPLVGMLTGAVFLPFGLLMLWAGLRFVRFASRLGETDQDHILRHIESRLVVAPGADRSAS